MNKKILFVLCFILFSSFIYSQNNFDASKSISIIENLYYKELVLLEKIYHKIDISINNQTKKVTFNRFHYLGGNISTEHNDSFYLEDLNNNLMIVKLMKFSELDDKYADTDNYSINITLKAKDISIKRKSIKINKKEFPFPVKKDEYLKSITITNYNNPSLSICKKFIKNFVMLFKIKNVKYFIYDKSIDDFILKDSPF